MCRVNRYRAASGGLGPTAKNATARENHRIGLPIILDDGHFEVSVKWGAFDFQPSHLPA